MRDDDSGKSLAVISTSCHAAAPRPHPRSTVKTVQFPGIATLSALRNGRHDPTTLVTNDEVWRATITPVGPGALHARRVGHTTEVTGIGPGGDWMVSMSPHLLGVHDVPPDLDCPDVAVHDARRRHGGIKLVRSGTPYHELIPAVLGQRVTAYEAARQWRLLCITYGTKAPTADVELWFPPEPESLARLPYHELHRFGVERRRAEALRVVARHYDYLSSLNDLADEPSRATSGLTSLHGIGQWTAAVAGFVAFGDSDAVAVGDFHLKNMVSFALTGRHRGTDDQMVELLERYRPHRGRVIRWLSLDGWSAPKHGPRRRNLNVAQF